MPEIKTAEEAIETAERFVRRYYIFLTLKRVAREQGAWLVEFDVGLIEREIVRIKLDGTTGSIIEYSPAK